MRIEISAAFALGILVPVLETIRRGIGHWRVDFTTMFTDYVAGALLLVAGVQAVRRAQSAGLWLVLAWSWMASMMSGSFWSHIEYTGRGLANEPNNGAVLLVKGLLWTTCVAGLILSFRRFATQSSTARAGARD